jgi:cytochrome P450
VPGPWYARYTNLPLKLAVISGRRIHFVHALHQKYGPYVRISPNEIAVNDLAGCKQLHGIGSGFVKNQWYMDVTLDRKPGLFTLRDVRAHAAQRRLFARPFSKTFLREHWEEAVREKISYAVTRMEDELERKGKVDVMKWWILMASDVSSHLMFGDSFHTLERGEVNEYIRTLAKLLQGSGIRAEMPWVAAVLRWIPLPVVQELFNGLPLLMEYGKAAVEGMKATQGGRNIFANMMAEAEKGESIDDAFVQVEATNLIVAGTDTTAITLTYLLYAVLRTPGLREDLCKEVASLEPRYTEADLESLPLLNAVIEETLRLYGAAPGMLPSMLQDNCLEMIALADRILGDVPPGGVSIGSHASKTYFLPEGTVVSTQSYSLHRDPLLFPDPERFVPKRWMKQEDILAVSSAGKAAFSAFGSGARSCLGIHLAYMELRLGAAEFFQRIQDVKLAPSTDDKCMEQENYFLIQPKGHRCEVVGI